ncbi:hypothetical protein ACJRO7_011356 [Eucalyptus globulus]|uniref:Uncharacterized protein n=1 Tax=Eucalyptus globulus TaxID=34317 RepID=A0ABD3LIH9_EUCGL
MGVPRIGTVARLVKVMSQTLSLDNVCLIGKFGFVAVSGVIMLQNLSVSRSQLTGIVSELDLHSNGFAGDVTKLLSLFHSVEYADLSYNELFGSLDLVLGNSNFLSSIRYLNVSSNSSVFETSKNRLVGKIPSFNFVVSSGSPARKQPVVGFFAASAVAGELYDLVCDGSYWGNYVEGVPAHLTGTLPIQTCQYFRLTSFQISDNLVGGLFPNNSLSGPLPWEIDRYRNLVYLDLPPNYFEGGLPNNLLDELQGFNVSYNNFSAKETLCWFLLMHQNLQKGLQIGLNELGTRMRTATKIALIGDLVGESNSSVAKVIVDLSYIERIDELVSSHLSLLSSSNPLPSNKPNVLKKSWEGVVMKHHVKLHFIPAMFWLSNG